MTAEYLEVRDGLCTYRPQGKHSLVEAVDLVSKAVAYCRDRSVGMLLVDATGFVDLPVPTLVDRFLMVEEWAQEAKGIVVVAMVASPEYIHPQKFAVKVALEFGLVCDVYASEADSLEWLLATAAHAGQGNR